MLEVVGALEGVREIKEVTMLVLTSKGRALIVFNENNARRGWTYVSTKVRPEEDAIDAVRRVSLEKLGLDLGNKRIKFVKRKEKKSVPFSSFTVDLDPGEFDSLLGEGPRGHTVRAVPIDQLAKYLDRGRYDMGASNQTGIPTL